MEIKLETINDVAHVDLNNLVTGGSVTGRVEMQLGARILHTNPDSSTMVRVQYGYFDNSGNQLPTKDGGIFELTEGVAALSQSINDQVSEHDNIVDQFNEEVLIMAKVEFAAAFGTTVANIQEVA